MLEKHIFVCTHGKMGVELVKTAEMIIGKVDNVHSFSLMPETSPDAFRESIESAVLGVKGKIICLTDLFGGTPCNIAMLVSRDRNMKVMGGVNLGMFMEVYTQKDHLSLIELTDFAENAGKDSCVNVSKKFSEVR